MASMLERFQVPRRRTTVLQPAKHTSKNVQCGDCLPTVRKDVWNLRKAFRRGVFYLLFEFASASLQDCAPFFLRRAGVCKNVFGWNRPSRLATAEAEKNKIALKAPVGH